MIFFYLLNDCSYNSVYKLLLLVWVGETLGALPQYWGSLAQLLNSDTAWGAPSSSSSSTWLVYILLSTVPVRPVLLPSDSVLSSSSSQITLRIPTSSKNYWQYKKLVIIGWNNRVPQCSMFNSLMFKSYCATSKDTAHTLIVQQIIWCSALLLGGLFNCIFLFWSWIVKIVYVPTGHIKGRPKWRVCQM